ncbi:MAG: radical SAM protein [Spirochaetales bacterium]|nr:radical SAM protein [Spirochaetales bacterium]
MDLKKVVFIEPKAQNLHIYTRYELPRLGNVLLATLARNAGYEVEVLFIDEEEVYASEIMCDLVALTTITTTANQTYRIGDYFRSREIPVVIGGPHVSFLVQEAMEHADFCIVGEGEIPFMSLLESLKMGTPLQQIPNLVFRNSGNIICNETRPPECDINSLPMPDLSLINRTRKNGARHFYQNGTIPIQTSRGCPFDCTFCSVTSMFGKRYRYRSTDKIIEEMLQYNPKKNWIFFYDDNFAANRRHTKELLREMIARGLRFKWSTQVRTDIAKDPELLDLMYKAGCRVLFIGLESIDPAVLKEMKKSQSAEEIEYAIQAIRKKGIFVHGMFVFGFDADTPETIESTVDFAIKQKIDSVQCLILTPLPGTPLYYKIEHEGRLIHRNWEKYDAHHVTFLPKNMTAYQLQNLQIRAHGRFYSIKNIFKRLFSGSFIGFVIGLYANRLNKKWQRQEKKYVSGLQSILEPKPAAAKANELVNTLT